MTGVNVAPGILTMRLIDLHVEQPYVLLPGVHIALTPPTLRLRAREGNLDHLEVINGQAPHEARVRAEQTFEQLRPQRGRIAVAAEQLLVSEEQIDGHPEWTGVL
jgi:hypothetical protein